MEIVEQIVAHAQSVGGARAGVDEAYLRRYFAHVDEGDLADRTVEDLFGLAAEHAQLAAEWERGSNTIVVSNPRIDVHGWENAHTVVMLVADGLGVDANPDSEARQVAEHRAVHRTRRTPPRRWRRGS